MIRFEKGITVDFFPSSSKLVTACQFVEKKSFPKVVSLSNTRTRKPLRQAGRQAGKEGEGGRGGKKEEAGGEKE